MTDLGHLLVRQLLQLRGLPLDLTLRRKLDLLSLAYFDKALELFLQCNSLAPS